MDTTHHAPALSHSHGLQYGCGAHGTVRPHPRRVPSKGLPPADPAFKWVLRDSTTKVRTCRNCGAVKAEGEECPGCSKD